MEQVRGWTKHFHKNTPVGFDGRSFEAGKDCCSRTYLPIHCSVIWQNEVGRCLTALSVQKGEN